jgi:RPA family protein
MTDEELEQEMQNLSENIDELSKADSLTKQEKRRQHILELKKETLERIKQAREKKNQSQEVKLSMDYALLEEYGEKHPLLLHLARIKLRGHIL